MHYDLTFVCDKCNEPIEGRGVKFNRQIFHDWCSPFLYFVYPMKTNKHPWITKSPKEMDQEADEVNRIVRTIKEL